MQPNLVFLRILLVCFLGELDFKLCGIYEGHYVGELKDDKAYGEGIFTVKGGDLYKGTWKGN